MQESVQTSWVRLCSEALRGQPGKRATGDVASWVGGGQA